MLKRSYYSALKKNVEKALKTYDSHSLIQQISGDSLISLLPKTRYPSFKALDLGCGNGLITQKLVKFLTLQHLDLIDLSPRMLTIAEERISIPSVHTQCRNFDEYKFPKDHWNLIFSNMSVQWSTNLPKLIRKIHQGLKPEGSFVFSLPLEGTFCELQRQKITTQSFFSFKEIHWFLEQNNFIVTHSFCEKQIQRFESLYSGLKNLKACGVTSPKKTGRRITKGQLSCPTTLTYVLGYFVARKPPLF